MQEEFNWKTMVRRARPDSGVLTDAGLRKFLLIHQVAIEAEPRTDQVGRERLHELFGCLSKLSALLAQVSRAAAIAEELTRIPFDRSTSNFLHPNLQDDINSGAFRPGMGVSYDQHDIVSIVESVIFQAGATMDRLAVFIGKHCGAQDRQSISILHRTLLEAQQRDVRAEYLFRAYCQVRPHVEGLLVGKEVNGKFVHHCLRHDLIHNISLREFELMPLHLEWLPDGRALRFDSEFEYSTIHWSMRIGALATIRNLTHWVSYIVLYAASVFLAKTEDGALLGNGLANEWDFGSGIGEPAWMNPTVRMSDFEDAIGTPESIPVTKTLKRWPNVTQAQCLLHPCVFNFSSN